MYHTPSLIGSGFVPKALSENAKTQHDDFEERGETAEWKIRESQSCRGWGMQGYQISVTKTTQVCHVLAQLQGLA